MKQAKTVPTDQELEILKLVWQRGEATVREIYQDLLLQRPVAYTTILTMMGILEQKGHLTKREGERAYIFKPAQPQAKVRGRMVKEFVNRVFNGSAKPLLVHLMEDQDMSREDLAEIEALLRKRKKK
jgi:BlaI family transcriptional regulator, penicillinase repressor